MKIMKTIAEKIGPLNRAPYYPNLIPGERGGILVTDDHRVLLLRPDDKNYLLFPTDSGNIWYDFRTERVTKFGADYAIKRVGDRDWNPFTRCGLFLHNPEMEKPDMGECWEVDYGFPFHYRSEAEARSGAESHKQTFGGVGGEYEKMGWYPARPISTEEDALIFGQIPPQ